MSDKQGDLDPWREKTTQIGLIGYDISVLADMVLVVWRFLHPVSRDIEVIGQIDVATVDPGLNRRLRYGAAIGTAATLEFRYRVDLVFVPIMGVGACCGGNARGYDDEPSHGIPRLRGGAARSNAKIY
ncbi:hypothetical protein [Mesorhizobium captivum]|uniref:hypothetical protein n=1 Tax=Mesorhizobium captivum TaxID=3072319 RepID=UPI002A24A193|nr:hypothetical protein [Mesorhizobium sp. VK23E]MDX8512591.1 hypothetical protein [Mesorhizobium sp. VK23E]